jgi:prefoldin subunit 5
MFVFVYKYYSNTKIQIFIYTKILSTLWNKIKKIRKKMATRKNTESTVNSIAGSIKPPISFKEFAKEPVKGLLFIVIIAVGYLYVDGKINYTDQIETQGKKIEILEKKVETLTDQLRKSDSALSAAMSKISVLQDLGKIK